MPQVKAQASSIPSSMKPKSKSKPIPPESPLKYDTPLLKKNAKALSSSAGVIWDTKRSETSSLTSASGSSSSVSGFTDHGLRAHSPGYNSNDEDVNCTVFEVEEWGSKRWIRLEVIEPVTITAKNFFLLNTTFTTYLIRIETNHYAFSLPFSEVRRRYSEYVWLRNKLSVHHPNKVIPPLPPKHFFSITNFNEKIINERRYGLGKFLQRVFRSSVLLSDSALHMFLQTNMTTKEIDARVSEEEGNRPFPSQDIPLSPSTPIPISIQISGTSSSYQRSTSSASGSSSSSSSSSGCHSEEERGKGRRLRESDHEDYCDVSSSEDGFEIDVET